MRAPDYKYARLPIGDCGPVVFPKATSRISRSVICRVSTPTVPFFRGFLANMAVVITLSIACSPASSHDVPRVLGSFRIPSDGDLIILPVQVGNRTYSFALDTGCFGLVYDVALRPELGHPVTRGVSMSPGGQIEVEGFAPPTDAMLGAIRLRGAQYVWTLDLRSIREFTGYDIMGLIGIEPLAYHIVEIDFDSGWLRFLNDVSSIGVTPIPLTDTGQGTLAVGGRIPDEGQGRFLLDTGYSASGTLSTPKFKELRDQGHLARLYARSAEFAGGTRRVQVGALDEFRFGSNTHIGLDFSSVPGESMIGLGVLSRYRVTLDFPGRRLYLVKGRRFRDQQRRDMSGLAITRRDGHTIVTHVAIGSPAKDAGLQKGDELLCLDAMDAQSERMFLLRKSLSREGAETEVHLRRGESTLKVSVPLRDWRVYDDIGPATATTR